VARRAADDALRASAEQLRRQFKSNPVPVYSWRRDGDDFVLDDYNDAAERITEFYGPGIVELSRLTTGKANKEIEELSSFLIAHGYDQSKVRSFFAPLARGVDVIDHTQHAREFYAYVNANGHLVNEGIVASMPLLQELSSELAGESQQLVHLKAPFGTYIGFAPAIDGVEYLGIRLIGMVSLKGLDNVEIGEVVPFAPGEAEVMPLEASESLVMLLRQDFHARDDAPAPVPVAPDDIADSTTERIVPTEIVICVKSAADAADEVLIGEWDPVSDDVRNPLRIPHGDFQRLFSLSGELTPEALGTRKDTVRDIYQRLSDRSPAAAVPLTEYRERNETEAFVLGEIVEKL
jgi:hypothetical protein